MVMRSNFYTHLVSVGPNPSSRTHVHGRLLPYVEAQHRQETGGGPQLFLGHGDEYLEAADARGDWRVPQ